MTGEIFSEESYTVAQVNLGNLDPNSLQGFNVPLKKWSTNRYTIMSEVH